MDDELTTLELEEYYVVFIKNDIVCFIKSGPYYNQDECTAEVENLNNQQSRNSSGYYRAAVERKQITLEML